MKITDKIISIPPFISTTWDNVCSLHMEGSDLLVGLFDGSHIQIPNLPEDVIKQLFDKHATIIEQMEDEPDSDGQSAPFNLFETLSNGLQLGVSGMDGMGIPMGHNSDQANSPLLPPELLGKIAQLAKLITPEGNTEELPKAEPHCNCMYCQVARALRIEAGVAPDDHEAKEPEGRDDPVTEDDLRFCQWDIKQMGNSTFEVTNRLDRNESYQVHLAEPVGCTCGMKNCEHLLAVLRS